MNQAPREAEGHFLFGLLEKAGSGPRRSIEAFENALALDPSRYDAAIELASQYIMAARNNEAIELLESYQDKLSNSPRYLDMAGTIYSDLGLPEKSWPLYQRANELQPDIDLFQSNLAACAIFLGRIELAEKIYRGLLKQRPTHQRNHYQFSRLRTVTDESHINEMLGVLEETRLPPDRNIFLYYALGKEYEDLQQWDKAFECYKKGGDAVTSVANYDISSDLKIIEAMQQVCNESWFDRPTDPASDDYTPIFVLGLPRTGSTLTERIISNHSQVRSVGETQHFETLLRTVSEVETTERMTPEIIRALAHKDLSSIGRQYLDAVRYRLADEPYFLEKLPYNFLYIGFIARVFPDAPVVYVRRNPMDACFAMYKQVFTWAYKFSYNLSDLAVYYAAHVRLLDHWKKCLGDRLTIVDYEDMVTDPEKETRRLLSEIRLDFEPQCLDVQANQAASTTASSVQIRQPVYTGSVERWRRYERQLEPLRQQLSSAGIVC